MSDGRWHTVQQGESAESLAARSGQTTQRLWQASENQDIRDLRADGHVLYEGDKVFIPAIRPKKFLLATDKTHRIQVKSAVSRLRMQFFHDGKPRSGLSYVLTIDSVQVGGTTDGDGFVDQPVPAAASVGELTVGEGEGSQTFKLSLRQLDPPEEATGLQARLRNLGYNVGPVDGESGDRTQAALAAFQRDHDLECSGEINPATAAKLKEVHGS